MRAFIEPIKTTVIGGLVFLVALAIVVFLGMKAWDLMKKLSARRLSLGVTHCPALSLSVPTRR